ncbi:MAG: GNAT family N-acetyltransferase [Candidatus Thermoplasmatota archaeon]|nr:GNAT family N-acetyltransferase [Candidatus Thermoplasmatota archaeon]
MRAWPSDEIIALYKAGSWWKDEYDPSGIPPLIEGSFDLVVAVDGKDGKAVGMGRLISDGVSDGYIQDVVVFPDRRGEGIGSMMVKELARYGKEKGLVWIGLIAEKGSSPFYERLGFRRFKGEPMLYEGEE